MGKVIQFKVKPKIDKRVDEFPEETEFLEQLEITRTLFLQGDLDKIIIIAKGEDLKCCSSNGVMALEAKEICRDFISNSKEYTD